MSILITGGKGFIGSRVIKKLVEHHEKVVCMDLKTTPGRLTDITDKITFVGGDVTNLKDIEDIIKEHSVTKIAHMVFFLGMDTADTGTKVSSTGGLYQQMLTMNLSTFHLYEAARLASIKRIIYPSSIAYHGQQSQHGNREINEESPSLAAEIYGISKHLCEVFGKEYNSLYNMEIINVRIPSVYGPGVKTGAMGVNLPCTLGGIGKSFQLPFRPEKKICLAHVDDVAEVIVHLLLFEKVHNNTYHIGGHCVSFKEIVDVARSFIPNLQESYKDTDIDPLGVYLIDNSRLKKDIGFQHRSLREGFKELIDISRREASQKPLSIE